MSGILDAATSGAAPVDDIAEMQKNGAKMEKLCKILANLRKSVKRPTRFS